MAYDDSYAEAPVDTMIRDDIPPEASDRPNRVAVILSVAAAILILVGVAFGFAIGRNRA